MDGKLFTGFKKKQPKEVKSRDSEMPLLEYFEASAASDLSIISIEDISRLPIMEDIISRDLDQDDIGNVTNDSESTACQNLDFSQSTHKSFSFTETSLEELRQLNEKFINERNWRQFHSPRNVLLALVGEVGELAEIFQWKGEVSEGLPELSEAEREHVGQEMSDVLIYLIDLASRCHIDLPKAVFAKMQANAKKYPVEKAYGQANKYTDYQ